MTVRERTVYDVVCDECGTESGDLDEPVAWPEPARAVQEWSAYDGAAYADGTHRCAACVSPTCCPDGEYHVISAAGPCTRCGMTRSDA